MSHKIDFNPKTLTRKKEGHYIKIMESIHQKDMTILNIYVLNTGALKYIK